jgi:hypothetical protein
MESEKDIAIFNERILKKEDFRVGQVYAEYSRIHLFFSDEIKFWKHYDEVKFLGHFNRELDGQSYCKFEKLTEASVGYSIMIREDELLNCYFCELPVNT